jgi:hypothetical protein
MNMEIQLLVTYDPVDIEEWPIQVQDFRRIFDQFRGIHELYLKLMKNNWKMSTCNWLDLETLGFWLIMSENLPIHYIENKIIY